VVAAPTGFEQRHVHDFGSYLGADGGPSVGAERDEVRQLVELKGPRQYREVVLGGPRQYLVDVVDIPVLQADYVVVLPGKADRDLRGELDPGSGLVVVEDDWDVRLLDYCTEMLVDFLLGRLDVPRR